MENGIRLVREECGVARLVLSRPGKKNALTGKMIREMIGHLERLQWEPAERLRFLVLEGEGRFFCSGADLSEMEETGNLSPDENIREAFVLARLFRELAALPFPTMAKVSGGALAGAMGLVSAADIVVAEETAIFGTPEVRIGLLPAVISLYLARKVGLSRLAAMSLLGKNFSAGEASSIGLVHHLVPNGQLDSASAEVERGLLSCGPEALRRMKLLLLKISPLPENEIEEFAATQIAEARASGEAAEGFLARREKRVPNWVYKKDEDGKA